MLFAVICCDKPGSAGVRAGALEAHRTYIDGYASALVTSGPLLEDDGATRNGQLYLIDVADKDAAQRFVDDDPFTRAGLFDTVLIRRIKPVIVDGQRLTP